MLKLTRGIHRGSKKVGALLYSLAFALQETAETLHVKALRRLVTKVHRKVRDETTALGQMDAIHRVARRQMDEALTKQAKVLGAAQSAARVTHEAARLEAKLMHHVL